MKIFTNFIFLALLLISKVQLMKIKSVANSTETITLVSVMRYTDETPIPLSLIIGFNTKIIFYKMGTNTEFNAKFTNDGFYEVRLIPGHYLRRIESDGFFGSYEHTEVLSQNDPTYTQYRIYLTSNGKVLPKKLIVLSSIRGKILNSQTGIAFNETSLRSKNASVTFRNIKTNETISSSILPQGIYSANLPSGEYERMSSVIGFSDSTTIMTVLTSSNETDPNNRILISEVQHGGYRMILTWGLLPKDLDSHLILPTNPISEVFFDNKTDSEGLAALDIDAQEGLGPETITLKIIRSGLYRYFVHFYSNEISFVNSNARVVVYNENKQILDVRIPQKVEVEKMNYTFWHVFDIDGDLNQLTVVNQMTLNAPFPNAVV